jgi:hypothetical protein
MSLLKQLEILLDKLNKKAVKQARETGETMVHFNVFHALKEAVEGSDEDYDHSLAIGVLLDSIENWCE